MPHEPATHEDPRKLLERAEQIAEPTHEELAFALGRLLVWLLDGDRLTKIGERVLIVAYMLRPDLIGGATLEQIAARRGHGRSSAHNLARRFTRTFGVKSINGKVSAGASARYSQAWHKAHPHANLSSKPTQHLWLVNMLTEWRATMREADAWPKTPQDRERMRRELEPLARILEELED